MKDIKITNLLELKEAINDLEELLKEIENDNILNDEICDEYDFPDHVFDKKNDIFKVEDSDMASLVKDIYYCISASYLFEKLEKEGSERTVGKILYQLFDSVNEALEEKGVPWMLELKRR